MTKKEKDVNVYDVAKQSAVNWKRTSQKVLELDCYKDEYVDVMKALQQAKKEHELLEKIEKVIRHQLKTNREILNYGGLKVMEQCELEGQVMALEIIETIFLVRDEELEKDLDLKNMDIVEGFRWREMKKYKTYFDKKDTPFRQDFQPNRKYHVVWKRVAYQYFLGHKVVKCKQWGIFPIRFKVREEESPEIGLSKILNIPREEIDKILK